MSDVDEILRADAARWQRAIDAGARPIADRTPTGHRSGRRAPIPIISGIAVIAAVVLGLLLAGAGGNRRSANSGSAVELRGVRWLEPISGGTVVFSEDTARVFDGCTGGLYELTANAGAVVIGKPVGRKIVCGGVAPPPGGPARRSYDVQQAAVAKFDQILDGRVSWTRTGATLVVTSSKGTLTLRADGTRALQVSGQDWSLDRIAIVGAELPGPDLGSLHIAAGGASVAALPCGSLTAHATITDTTITFSSVQHPAGSTCSTPSAARAQRVILAVLKAKINYVIRGEQLMLDGPNNSLLVYGAAAH